MKQVRATTASSTLSPLQPPTQLVLVKLPSLSFSSFCCSLAPLQLRLQFTALFFFFFFLHLCTACLSLSGCQLVSLFQFCQLSTIIYLSTGYPSSRSCLFNCNFTLKTKSAFLSRHERQGERERNKISENICLCPCCLSFSFCLFFSFRSLSLRERMCEFHFI